MEGDGQAVMLYEAYRRHGILPHEFYKLRKEEQLILRAFIEMELEEGARQ